MSSPVSTRAVHVLRLAAFSSSPDGGNPAGVVLDADELTDDEMLGLAADVGYSETAFVVATNMSGGTDGTDDAPGTTARSARVRYFSPVAEVPFCGHATLATAVALADRYGLGPIDVRTSAGTVTISTEPGVRGGARAAFTSVEPDVRDLDPQVTERLLGLLGLVPDDLDDTLPVCEAFAGNWHPVVVVRDLDALDRVSFEPHAVRALMDERGWQGTVTVACRLTGPAPTGVDLQLEARNPFPVGDIVEDPATGSAAAALGAFLRDRRAVVPPARVVVHQGRHVGRPGVLVVDVPAQGGMTVSGDVAVIDA
ncbi:PhzF family phenazine biosynthesis protein [Cellulomonas sp. HZM]|uniref:PhzF family phenazine biosynthesis protein n=1 Tax=Cellulomonas sp. HZM TaxID=1454010 RepID=UPI000493AB17|nr:PhzF family phenazine biosynthesis protein [Cellulomonas sp. HZM]